MDQPSDFLKARLAKLPPVPSFPDDPTQDEATDTSTETDSSTTSIRTIVPLATTEPSKPADPLPWTRFFKENLRIPSSTDPSQSFNVYYSPPTDENAPVYVFHHGAGSSALSFALVSENLTSAISCGVIAFDVRYHGTSFEDHTREWDLSLDTLAKDEVDVVNGVANHASWGDNWPDLILVGHRYLCILKVLTVVWEVLYLLILLQMSSFQRYV
jgi:protein phosphatase methylesterase 1